MEIKVGNSSRNEKRITENAKRNKRNEKQNEKRKEWQQEKQLMCNRIEELEKIVEIHDKEKRRVELREKCRGDQQ